MDALSELVSGLSGGSRAIVIASREVDLRGGAPDNFLFVLKIGEGSLAAGGRGGGFGERKVIHVQAFQARSGAWTKLFDKGEEEASSFEVPYYVSRLPMTLPDGAETMGYGVVDPDLVVELSKKAGILSSP